MTKRLLICERFAAALLVCLAIGMLVSQTGHS